MNPTRKVVLVTGGTGGIGKAICKRLLEDGFIVYLCDIQDELKKSVISELSQFGEIFYGHLDVSEEAQWEKTYSKIMQNTRFSG